MDAPRQFVVAAIRSAIGLDDATGVHVPIRLAENEAATVASIASRNKIGGLIRFGALNADLETGSTLDRMLKAQQSMTMVGNLRNLLETERVAELFSARGMDFVILKGPVRSQEVFGGLDCRLSNDIDILVRPYDYRRACHVLCEGGYRPGVSPGNSWWHDHLGESPFLPSDGYCTVDVHQKVQQPGGPSPVMAEAFLDHAVSRRAADREFRVLDPSHALLLAYISASKAVRNEEYWLGYAAEIASVRHDMSPGALAAFTALAREQGLSRLVGHVDQIIGCLLSWPPGRAASTTAKHAEKLAAFPFGSGVSQRKLFHRSRLLWAWAEGEGPARVVRAAGLYAEMMRSDMRRRREK